MACCGRSSVPRVVNSRTKPKEKSKYSVVSSSSGNKRCPKCGSQTKVKYTRRSGSLRRYLSCLKGHITYE